MSVPSAHLKDNFDHWVEAGPLGGGEVGSGVNRQAIVAGSQGDVRRQQLWASAVLIGSRGAKRQPRAVVILPLQSHRCVARRFPEREIENMRGNVRGNGGHGSYSRSHFAKRSRVICRCCSAASSSSTRSPFFNRPRKICRTCPGDLPVAHTMKIRLNLRSYS